MSEIIDRGAEAMRAKRRELIAQPLDRIWPDLMRAAISAIRVPSEKMMVEAEMKVPELFCFEDMDKSPSYIAWQAMIDEALATPAIVPHDGSTTSVVKDSLTTADTTQEKT